MERGRKPTRHRATQNTHPSLELSVHNQQRDLLVSRRSVRDVLLCCSKKLNIQHAELEISLVTRRRSGALHEKFFGDPRPTDCMTFPLAEAPEIAGEIVLCPAIAIQEALKRKCTPYQELTLYLIHGLLHLMGYDDLLPKDRQEMRKMERKLIRSQALLSSYSLG